VQSYLSFSILFSHAAATVTPVLSSYSCSCLYLFYHIFVFCKPCLMFHSCVLSSHLSTSSPTQGHTTYGAGPIMSRVVLAPPGLSYKPVTSASCDRGNISHDPTRDSSHDPSASTLSRDRMARDPGNLQPHDPGKITHDLSRNWSSITSHDKTHFRCASNLLINMWQIVGMINKTHLLNNQQTRDTS